MDLEGLLNASLELEKRKATDQLLRKYFSSIWKETGAKSPAPKPARNPANSKPGLREVTFQFPAEMCELLEMASKASGKTPSEILEACFAEFYLKKVEQSPKK